MRSSGVALAVDRDALAADPAERHVGGADAVRAEHDGVERVAAADAHADAFRRSRSAAGLGTVRGAHVIRRLAGQRGEQHRRLRPPAPPARRPTCGGPATSTSSTTSAGATEAIAAAMPACARRARPRSRRHAIPAAIGGRFGPSRTTSSRASTTRTARPWRSARRPRRPRRHRCRALPPKAPPLAERRWPARRRHAPRGVRFEVGGLDPRRAQRSRPVAVRHASGHESGAVVRRPGTLPGRAGGPRSASRRPPTSRRRRAPPRARRRARASSAKPPRPRATVRADRAAACDPPAARAGGAAAIAGRGRARPAVPNRARPPRRSSASPCTGRGGRAAPGRPRPAVSGARGAQRRPAAR